MTEEIRDKNNKLLGTITTNSQGLKEVRTAYNERLAVYDQKRNETLDKYHVVITKYDSLLSILHEHINNENQDKRLKRESRSKNSAEELGESVMDNLISGLKTISISDVKKVKDSDAVKGLTKELSSVRKGVWYWAGMALLVPIVLLVLLFIVAQLVS